MLGLKHFVLRSEARKLYRDVLRAIKGVDAETAAGVRLAAREQFDSHENEVDIERERRAPVQTHTPRSEGAEAARDCPSPLCQPPCPLLAHGALAMASRYTHAAGGWAAFARPDEVLPGHRTLTAKQPPHRPRTALHLARAQ
jgi:hypothetical protein